MTCYTRRFMVTEDKGQNQFDVVRPAIAPNKHTPRNDCGVETKDLNVSIHAPSSLYLMQNGRWATASKHDATYSDW